MPEDPTEITRVDDMLGPIHLPLDLEEAGMSDFELSLWEFGDQHYHVLRPERPANTDWPYLRIESACTYAHLYRSQLCDCEQQLRRALTAIGQEGGLLIYALDQHGRGVGLKNHVRVYQAEQEGRDTVDAHQAVGLNVDARHYEDILGILGRLEINRVRLLTNNPDRIGFFGQHLGTVRRVPLEPTVNRYNIRELMIKKERMGHDLPFRTDESWMKELFESGANEGSYAALWRVDNVQAQGGEEDLVRALTEVSTPRREDFVTVYCGPSVSTVEHIESLIDRIEGNSAIDIALRIVGQSDMGHDQVQPLFEKARNAGIIELRIRS